MGAYRGMFVFDAAVECMGSYIDIQGPAIQLNNDDIYKWNVALIILNPDSLYYGGYFKASMTFPKNYPYSPPGIVLSLQCVGDGCWCLL